MEKQPTVKKLGNVSPDGKSDELKEYLTEKEIKTKLVEGRILIRMSVQIAGSPEQHINDTMDIMIERINKTENVEIVKTDIYKAKPDSENAKMFVSFSEVDLLVKNLIMISELCYDYMPASIDILEPIDMKFSSHDLTMFLNDILSRLHRTDMILKNTIAENKMLDRNCIALFKNIFKIALDNGAKTKEELAKVTGIQPDEIDKLIKGMVKEGLIEEKDGKISSKMKNG